MIKVAFYTLGCKLNQSESEALASAFQSRGFFIIPSSEEADLYIVNSCTVTSMAEQKARRMIRKFSSGTSLVVVTGCYAQLDPNEIKELASNVIVTGMDGKSKLIDLPIFLQSHQFSGKSLSAQIKEFFLLPSRSETTDRFRFNIAEFSYHSRAFIKIQDGCDNRCHYCRIPLARGNSQSLSLPLIQQQVDALLKSNYKEIVLTGINISAWSDSPYPKTIARLELADLILAVAKQVTAAGARLRLSSLEPDKLTSRLLDALCVDGVVPHLHLALQSLSQSVLTRMNRHYPLEPVLEWIKEYRRRVKNPFMATDLITGFDGESDEEFDESYKQLQELNFAHLHVFPFSKREGTVSYQPKAPVPERIRDERAEKLRILSEESLNFYWETFKGKSLDFLVEGEIEKEGLIYFYGLTENYLQAVATFKIEEYEEFKNKFMPIERGQIYPVRVDEKAKVSFL